MDCYAMLAFNDGKMGDPKKLARVAKRTGQNPERLST